MNLAEYSLKNRVVVYFALMLVFVGGLYSYFNMGKLEDSVFTIKTALVITQYSGASPHEVEMEVSEIIERAAQDMDCIKEIFSSSYAGLSIVQINLEDKLRADEMPQVWDILRKKIKDAHENLPSGVEPIVVDDFGDVYGMFYAITGDGFSYEKINDYAQYIKRELLIAEDVGKISLFGNKLECIDIIMSDAKISELGINPGVIIGALNSQANIAASGTIELNHRNVRVAGNTAFKSIDEIRNTLIQIGNEQMYLKDIAKVKKSYLEPAHTLMRHNKKNSIGLAISTAKGGDVLVMAEDLARKLEKITPTLPIGIEMVPIYNQAQEVIKANDMFIINLIESVGIVIVILLLSMGLRSGLLIGSGLVFSILGTLTIMYGLDISLHRTSLAAIIVAMGMLVDNAIVVTDGTLVALQKGMNRRKAITGVAKATAIPLLGATVIAILAFMPVFFSPNAAGEICRDLVLVLAISLSLSWIFAMTQTPLTSERFLKLSKEIKNPFDGKVYVIFKSCLETILKYRIISISCVFILLIVAVFAFSKTKKAFFLPIEKPYFLVDYWLPEGSSINQVSDDLSEIENYLFENYSEIENITTSLSQTPPRYILSVHTENNNSSFGQLMIETHSCDEPLDIRKSIKEYLKENYPDARARIKGYIGGPPIKYRVEARFIGPDPEVLRRLAEETKEIMRSEPACGDITDNWRNKVMTWNPKYSPIKACRAGITRADMGNAILRSTSTGLGIGLYRENEERKPIFLKVDNQSLNNIERIKNTSIWSERSITSVPLKEVVEDMDISWENSVIQRYNRQRAITVQCDPVDPEMTGSTLFGIVQDKIEAISLPDGYSMMWDGEYKPSLESNEAVRTFFPLAFLLIIFIIIMLFNSIRQSLIVIAIIPLSIIGVAIGLFVTGKAFGFMAIVGFLGLIGMVLKNAIVLIDQIDINLNKEGMIPYDAIVNATVSRMRPVMLASLTTILGMSPLVTDAMYGSMAVTIMFGLLFATVLTLLVVPLLYVLFYKVKIIDQKK